MNKNAQALGKLGGLKKSVKKTQASRLNGKLGGRPITSNKYNTIHIWLKRNYKKGGRCFNCLEEKKLQFALKKGFEHARDLTHYLMLCSLCHKRYDLDKLTKEELNVIL